MRKANFWRARPDLCCLLMIAAAGLLLSLPVLLQGPLPNAKDFANHLARYLQFREQFWSGDFYPRWLQGANAGLGSPVFFVYGPFFYYFASLFYPLCQLLPGSVEHFEFRLPLAIAMMASGVATYRWLRLLTSRTGAFAGAALYMAAPYHLWADLYVRCAAAELWAFVWLPTILYALERIAVSRRSGILWMAAGVMMLVVTHILSVALLLPFVAGYVLTLMQSHVRRTVFAGAIVGTALASLLSSFYLLPALFHETNISLERFTSDPYYSYKNNFLVTDFSLFVGDAAGNPFKWYATWIAIVLTLICLFSFLLCLNRGSRRNRLAVFAVVSAAVSLYLMTPWSSAVWDALPMLQGIQFPWRFLLVLSGVSSLLFALAVGREGTAREPWGRLVEFALLLIAVASCALPSAHILWLYSKKAAMTPEYELLLRSRGDDLTRAWARWSDRETLEPASLLSLSMETPSVVVAGGMGSGRIKRLSPRDVQVFTNLSEPATVQIRQLYYPGWIVRVAGESASSPAGPAPRSGLTQFIAPAGRHELLVSLPKSTPERLGEVMSGLGLLGCAILLIGRGVSRTLGRLFRA